MSGLTQQSARDGSDRSGFHPPRNRQANADRGRSQAARRGFVNAYGHLDEVTPMALQQTVVAPDSHRFGGEVEGRVVEPGSDTPVED